MTLRSTVTALHLMPLARRVRTLAANLRQAVLEWRLGAPWSTSHGSMRRHYRDYGHYVRHQASKLGVVGVAAVDAGPNARLRQEVGERIGRYGFARGTSVLCLAARRGGEVQAFLDHHCFAVGVDLNPGPANRFVVTGDFHALQFPTGSVDVVFTNSLDHAFDLDRLAAEAFRVLKPGGTLLVETAHGFEETDLPSHWEATFWARTDDLVARLSRHGFELVERVSVARPLNGVHLHLRR